jgi:chemotaxis protein methyltransferase CheR
MPTDEYVDFCHGLRRLAGVDLTSYKRAQMERRIRSYLQRKSVPTLAQYLSTISKDREELDQFLDRITINVSELYRNPEQFEILRTKVVPELKSASALKIWSAGCSYGAEAYTLACMLAETLPHGRFEILGTDIDQRILQRAQRGHFSAADMRNVPPKVRDKYFDAVESGFTAKPTLRGHLQFRIEDLLRDRFQTGFDLVLCRNVVIYFTEPVRDALHRRLVESLRPGGYLLVGSSERVAEPRSLGLDTPAPFIYRKAD